MTSAVTRARHWYWQRISALVLAVCVLVHLGTIIYAVRGGLTAMEILSRTRGSWLTGGFYGLFVLACAVHVPIGLTDILEEWLGLRRHTAEVVAAVFAVVILAVGLRSVYAVTAT